MKPRALGAVVALAASALLPMACTSAPPNGEIPSATTTTPLLPAGSPPGSAAPGEANIPGTTPTSDLPASLSPVASAPLPHEVEDPKKVTGSLTGMHCHARGSPPYELPDPNCTPGAFDPRITAKILCGGRYTTKLYRPPASQTTKFKYKEAYPAYGVPVTEPTELDHLISLELGGSNDAANLWPEPPPSPNPKDSVENTIHRWICSVASTNPTEAQGRLETAQQVVAADWLTAEQILGIPGATNKPTAPATDTLNG